MDLEKNIRIIVKGSDASVAQLAISDTSVAAATLNAKPWTVARIRLSTLLQSFSGHLMPTSSGLFPRNFKKTFPIATRGEGCWIIADDGRRFLDASGQAAVVSIGHGVPEIGRAMAEQSSQLAFAHTTQFHSEPAEKLADRLLALAPANFHDGGKVYFTSGGSEATETAIKLARQYHLERKQPERFRVVSRRQSYHGSTLRSEERRV